MPKELKEGLKAPDFTAMATGGEEISLKKLKGKIVVLYFYPKDNTSGCTKQACAFRDANDEMKKLGVVVVGVSKDSLKSHDNFIGKYSLNFPLISDADLDLIKKYDVWREKSMYGKKSMGVVRSTFVIDGEGKIRKIWRKVKVDGHIDEVLEFVKTIV